MLDELRYTLVSDGVSDQALMPLLSWLLREQGVALPLQSAWADLRNLRKPPSGLAARIGESLRLYPCDLLFVHRDAERDPREIRIAEIQAALPQVTEAANLPAICVVPVRMQEAWMLFDEAAIRNAAGNPNGTQRLKFPPLAKLEEVPDPKAHLYEMLLEASGLQGRRRRQFSVRASTYRVAEFIRDFSPLRGLSAFRALEADIQHLVVAQGWNE